VLKRNSSRAIAIILGIFGLIWLHLSFDLPYPPPSNGQPDHSTQDDPSQNPADIEMADATIALAIFTAALVVSTILLWRATLKTARIAERALIDTERPFVFPHEMRAPFVIHARTKAIVKWNFSIVWKNSGAVPAMSVYTYFGMHISSILLPDDFVFTEENDTRFVKSVIGPDTLTESGPIPIRAENLEQIIREPQYLYFWGWAEYDDALPSTPRYRTEFCRQVIIHGDPANAPTISFSFITHPSHNGADGECTNPLRTGSPKNPKA
jgi:hypothetical protein